MLNEELKSMTPADRHIFWIKERDSIRLKKNREAQKPWTQNEILQSYKFTNVRRMDDRVSKWLWWNWYKKNIGHENIMAAVTLARHLNREEPLEMLGFPKKWKPKKIKKKLIDFKESGNKVFSGAYMITGVLNTPKSDYAVNVANAVHENRNSILNTDSMEATVDNLVTIKGISTFLAGQITADLRHSVHGKWSDKNRWAPMGPGSKRGMNRLHGRSIGEKITKEQFDLELSNLIDNCKCRLSYDITKRLEGIDYQNTLCEFDKFERALWGEGRPKQRYNGKD